MLLFGEVTMIEVSLTRIDLVHHDLGPMGISFVPCDLGPSLQNTKIEVSVSHGNPQRD